MANDDEGGGGGGGIALQAIMPPAESTKTERIGPEDTSKIEQEGPKTTEKQTVMSPGTSSSLATMDRATAAQLEANKRKQEIDSATAALQAGHSANERDYLAAQQLREDLLEDKHHDNIARKAAREEAQRQKLEDEAEHEGLYHDRSAPARVLAAFIQGIGAMAEGFGGGPNRTIEIFRHEDEMDRQRKLDHFTRSKEFLSILHDDTAAARDLLESEKKRLSQETITKIGMMQKELDANVKKLAVPGGRAAADATNAAFEEEKAKQRADVLKHYEREETRDSGRVTEGEEHKSGHGVYSHTVNTAQPGGTGNRAQGKAMEDASFASSSLAGMQNFAENGGTIPPLSQADRETLQNNITRASGGDHGALEKLLTTWGRDLSAIPRSMYDGLSGPAQERARLEIMVAAKRAAMLTGSSEHAKELSQLFQSAPNQTSESYMKTMEENRAFMQSRLGNTGQIGRTAAVNSGVRPDMMPKQWSDGGMMGEAAPAPSHAAPARKAETKAPPPKSQRAVDLATAVLKLKTLSKNSPERPRWERVRKLLSAKEQ